MQQSGCDLVLVNYRMLKVIGSDPILAIKRFSPGTPIVLISGYALLPPQELRHVDAHVGKGATLARIIHIFEDNKGLLCYKHVVKTMFAATKEASECLKITQHSVCSSQRFFASLS